MRLYLLKIKQKDEIGFPTVVVTNLNKVIDPNYYYNNMNDNKFLESESPIYLELIKWKGNPHELRDYHFWGAGSPCAYRVVSSKKFKAVLQLLNLPPHRFYTAEISVKQKIHNYFVFHLLQDWNHVIDYTKSVFNVVALTENERVVKRLNAGEVKNFEKYNEIIEMITEHNQYLYPAKLHFLPHINYDIWGLHGQIILSERAKQAIEKAEITGIAMPEINETTCLQNIEIVMNNQTYYSVPQSKMVQYENKLEVLNLVAEQETPYNKKP